MATTKVYSLSELIQCTSKLTLENLSNGRAYFNGVGWESFTIDSEDLRKASFDIAELIHPKSKERQTRTAFIIRNEPIYIRLANNIVLDKHSLKWELIPTQNYNNDMREIRNYFYKRV